MIQTLNRKKSFGTVYGHPQIGYVQDDQEFKHDGTLHTVQPEKPKETVFAAPTVDSLPTTAQLGSPELLKAIEGLSTQIKDLKPEPEARPDPTKSEAARRVWAERRAREAAEANDQNASTEPAHL